MIGSPFSIQKSITTGLSAEFAHPTFQDSFLDIDFDNTAICHDWRNHVPKTFCQLWEFLSIETRLAIYVMAKIKASAEVWD